MSTLAELDLPEINLGDTAFASDPYTPFEALRGQHWLAKSPTGYVVLTYDAMRDMLAMDDVLDPPSSVVVEAMDAQGTAFGNWFENTLLSQTGAPHKRIRALVANAFTPRNANFQRPVAREEFESLLDEWAPKGAFDFAELVSHYPIKVLCRMIGAPTEPIPRIKHALEVLGEGMSLDPNAVPRLNDATNFMWNYVDELIEARTRKGPSAEGQQDLLDELLAVTGEDGGLSDEELRYLILTLFVGGYDTSKNILTMVTYLLLDRPAVWESLSDDVEFARKVLDETFRFATIVATFRTVNTELTYNDVVFPVGTPLIFPTQLAGRDTSVFSNADTFDPHRKPEQRHLAFGRGMHICLGQFLARMQMEEALAILPKRVKSPRLNGEIAWRPFPGVWGIKTLPIAFDV